jgi:predicted nucleotidyltransferase
MPTALELTREEWETYLRGWTGRAAPATLDPEAVKRREALLERVREAALALKARFGVRRVILFGSLAHEAWFMDDSDVDLAVEGLRAADFWAAWRLAEEVVAVRRVDLVDYEVASEGLRGAIDRSGVEL